MHTTPRSQSTPRRVAPALALGLLVTGCSSGGGGAPPPPPATCPVVDGLAVASSAPSPGQTGVSAQAQIVVQFNTCLDPASVGAAAVSLYRTSGTAVAGAAQVDGAGTSLVFVPAAPLAYGATHSFLVKTSVRGSRGEQLPAQHAFSFVTRAAPETVPPATSASPPGGRYAAPQAVTLTCVDNAGGTGCASTRYTLDGSTPTAASPLYAAPISVDRDLTLRFFSTDVDGNAEAPRSAQYVIDTDPPGVASTQPPDGASGVRLDAVIRVAFDEPMSGTSLIGQPVFQPLTYTSGSFGSVLSEVTRVPTSPLDCATTYQLTVGTAATDVAGNALPEPYVFAFTTSDDCDEPRTEASLPSGVYTSAQEVTLSCDDGAGGSGCSALVYTLDGSLPTFSPPNGTVVAGDVAGPIQVGVGETTLRFRSQDAAGHTEVARVRRYSVSTTGFTWLAGSGGLARGIGAVPDVFVPVRSRGRTLDVSADPVTGRLYRVTDAGVVFSEDGATFELLPLPAGGATIRATAIAATGSRLYVGSEDGLYRSTDGGATFARVVWGRVSRVVAAGRDVFVGTESGLVYSNDRLRTQRYGRSAAVRGIAVSGDRVYVAYATEVGVSPDRGATWSYHTPASSTAVYGVAVSGTTAFAATDVGLAVSTDGGPFDVVRSTAAGLDARPVRLVEAQGANVYVTTRDPYTTAPSGFFVSTNGGQTFTRRYVPGGTRDADAYVIRAEGSTVHLGAYPSYWRSDDAGASFAMVDLNGTDARRVVGAGAKVYAGIADPAGFGGLVVSTDRGRTFRWFGPEHGLPSGTVDDLFLDGDTLYVSTWRGLAITSDDGATFDVRTEANSGIWQSSPETVWASGATVWAGAVTKLQRSTNSGQTFADRLVSVDPQTVRATGAGPTAKVYLSTSDGVWASSDGGASFVRRATADGLAESYIRDLDLAPDGALWVGTTSKLHVSRDGGATFQDVPVPSGVYPYTVHASGDAIYCGSGALAISTDGGQSFVVRTGVDGVEDVARIAP